MEPIFGIFGKDDLDVVEPSQASMIKLCRTPEGRPAAFVAETYGRLTGEPGEFICALGPGVLSFCFLSRASHMRQI